MKTKIIDINGLIGLCGNLPGSLPGRVRQPAINCIVIFLFLLLFSPSLSWIWRQMRTAENGFHVAAGLLLAGFGLRVLFGRRNFWGLAGLGRQMRWHWGPAALLYAACAGFVLNEQVTGIKIFSSLLLIVATYGLFGLYATSAARRNALFPFALLLLILPFEGYLDIFPGFPLRIYCADRASDLLSIFGLKGLSREAVIMLENRIALVDTACSGLNGLWAGLIYYFSLSWLEKKQLSPRWLGGLALLLSSLVLFNILRITALVAANSLLDNPALAEAVHEPLGIAGFIASCALGYLLLSGQKEEKTPELEPESESEPEPDSEPAASLPPAELGRAGDRLAGPLLIVFLSLCLFFYEPIKKIPVAGDGIQAGAPVEFQAQEIGLTPVESRFFADNAATARKYRFMTEGREATVVLVYSKFWKAQHDPRNCYQAGGFRIDYEETRVTAKGYQLKYLSLNEGTDSAAYWFQSPSRHTADYAARLFYSWRTPGEPWIMTSILWNSVMEPSVVEQTVDGFSEQIKRNLNNNGA